MLPSTPRIFIGSTTFTVRGLRCRRCSKAVAEAIVIVAGVTSVTLRSGTETGTRTVTVCVDQLADRADIASAIEQAGYTVVA